MQQRVTITVLLCFMNDSKGVIPGWNKYVPNLSND